MKSYEEIDKTAVKELRFEIESKAQSMCYSSVVPRGKEPNKHIGRTASELRGERKKKDRFSFYSEKELCVALYLFFCDSYTVKRIAKNCYFKDEDDKFTESMDLELPLGIVENEKKEMEETSVVEAVLKVRNSEERDAVTGMPFDLMEFRLVPRED